jgi:protein arginine kinase
MKQDKIIDRLLQRRVTWLADSGPEDDIAISSRIRLARNLRDLPFPIAADPENRNRVRLAVEMAVSHTSCLSKQVCLHMAELTPLDRQFLLERRLISREFCSGETDSVLLLCGDESRAIMVNEEDHLRIQTMRSGFQLGTVWSQITRLDDALAAELPYAFDDNLGFLTSCPTNVGTGMRASVMLHLPGLVLADQINPVIQGANRLGLAVRGIFGEGTENLGNLFQVSNQGTLGESETDILNRLEAVIRQVISHEKNARLKLLETRRDFLLDHVGRAYGTLRYGYIMNSQETLNSLSALRLGVDMGMVTSADIHTVNELFMLVQPAHLQKSSGRELPSSERDVFRSSVVRNRLKEQG